MFRMMIKSVILLNFAIPSVGVYGKWYVHVHIQGRQLCQNDFVHCPRLPSQKGPTANEKKLLPLGA